MCYKHYSSWKKSDFYFIQTNLSLLYFYMIPAFLTLLQFQMSSSWIVSINWLWKTVASFFLNWASSLIARLFSWWISPENSIQPPFLAQTKKNGFSLVSKHAENSQLPLKCEKSGKVSHSGKSEQPHLFHKLTMT